MLSSTAAHISLVPWQYVIHLSRTEKKSSVPAGQNAPLHKPRSAHAGTPSLPGGTGHPRCQPCPAGGQQHTAGSAPHRRNPAAPPSQERCAGGMPAGRAPPARGRPSWPRGKSNVEQDQNQQPRDGAAGALRTTAR